MRHLLRLCIVVMWQTVDAGSSTSITLLRNAEPHCLATKIGENWLITAKHCVHQAGRKSPDSPDLYEARWQGTKVSIKKIFTLGESYTNLGNLHGKDLAVLCIDKGIEQLPITKIAIASTDGPWFASTMKENVTFSSIFHLDERVLITPNVSCEGDSGGGLFNIDGDIVGVASWRTANVCGRGRSVYTRIDSYLKWVYSKLEESCLENSE